MSEALAEQAPVLSNEYAAPIAEQTNLGLRDRLLHSRAGRSAVAFIAAVGLGGLGEMMITDTASASVSADGNNLVCGGVPSKADAIRLDKGGADDCGHTDTGKAWARVGITLPVIRTMHKGVVCSTDGLVSEGREHSPEPAEDKVINLGGGDKIFGRPLSVWGDTCYDALVGHEADGKEVGILEGCGNGEGHFVPEHKHHPKRHHAKREKLEIQKTLVIAPTGELIPTIPTDTFDFDVTVKEPNGEKVKRHVVLNNNPQPVGKFPVGSHVTVKEDTPLGPDKYETLTKNPQKSIIRRRTDKVSFKDEELTDVCVNISGVQTSVPAGETVSNGVCETPPIITPPAPPETCPAGTNLENVNGSEECVTPKNGTEGPGTDTPGQPGGAGAGGQPGNDGGSGETCIDPADSTDGDMNPDTSGDVMYGTHDQFGYCVGEAQPLVNG